MCKGLGTPQLNSTGSNSGIPTQPSNDPNAKNKRRWYLGIQSKKDPAHVMTEIYRALFHLRCDWKKQSSYKIICRWKPNWEGHGESHLPQPPQPPSHSYSSRGGGFRVSVDGDSMDDRPT